MASHKSTMAHHQESKGTHSVPGALGLMVAAVLWPGLPQYLNGRKILGGVVMAGWIAFFSALGFIWWYARPTPAQLVGLGTNSQVLFAAQILLVVGLLVWVLLFIDTWRLAIDAPLQWARIGVVSMVNILVVSMVTAAATLSWGVLSASQTVVNDVFSATATSAPLHGRYNILLLGADSGADRTGLRPDSVTVASVNADTGTTVLIGLPRNLQNVPFAADSPMNEVYPDGFNCGDECLLNAVYLAGTENADLYPGTADPGLEATIDAVEGVTGLTMNYYIIVNMEGLTDLVDALGGVTMTVNEPIAMFGHDEAWKWTNDPSHYIPAGTHKLNGEEALWYGRSRVQSDDYTRMARQKCLMNGMLHQLSPQQVVLNAADIAQSGSAMVQTNIPASELESFADLALKSRNEPIASLSIVPPTYSSDPSYRQVRADVAAVIEASENPPSASAPTGSSPTSATTYGAPDEYAANDTSNLDSVCG